MAAGGTAAARTGAVIVFMDESGLSLLPSRRHAWASAGRASVVRMVMDGGPATRPRARPQPGRGRPGPSDAAYVCEEDCSCDCNVLLTVFCRLVPVVAEEVTVDDDAMALAVRTVPRRRPCPAAECGHRVLIEQLDNPTEQLA